jgi:HEAT repeat protein
MKKRILISTAAAIGLGSALLLLTGGGDLLPAWLWPEPTFQEKTVAEWVAALKDPSEAVRRRALATLNSPGPDGESPVPVLIKALKHEDAEIRSLAARALGGLAEGARPALPALVEALHDESADVRGQAAFTLYWVGPGSEKAVPHLVAMLRDRNRAARQNAAWALSRIDPETAFREGVSHATLRPPAVDPASAGPVAAPVAASPGVGPRPTAQ